MASAIVLLALAVSNAWNLVCTSLKNSPPKSLLSAHSSFIVCGSLPRGLDRPKREDKYCECDEGWMGINCNVCKSDRACDVMTETGDGGVCYTGGEVVKQNHQMCDVTNKAIRSLLG